MITAKSISAISRDDQKRGIKPWFESSRAIREAADSAQFGGHEKESGSKKEAWDGG